MSRTQLRSTAVYTRGHREGVVVQTSEVHETPKHMHAFARRNLFVAMAATMCAPAATELLLPPAARAVTLREMTSDESAAFTAAMENLFNEGFDSPRPDRFTPILLRIAFHDAGTWIAADRTGGANASIAFELGADPNNTVVRRFGWPIVQQIKRSLEGTAAASLSLADVIALAPAYGLGKMGGGDYMRLMKVGREDASREDPEWQAQLPAASLDVPGLKENFARKGFNTREMVVLSGSHTIGRIGGVGGARFDNSYYRAILESDRVGLGTDQAIARDPETRPIVQEFARNNKKFVDEFRAAYVKLSNFVV